MDCIFCKIIAGDLPSYKVYEDDDTLAFLDIGPTKHGHTLVVPKKHYANLEEITKEDLSAVIKTVKKVGKGIKYGLDLKGYNVMLNNDPVAGQLVPHLHFHLVPRNEDDGLEHWPRGKYNEGEAEYVQKKIKSAI